MKLLIALTVMAFCFQPAHCEDRLIEAVVGNEIIIGDTLSFSSIVPVDTIEIGGMIVIANQTMFYVDSIGYEVLDAGYKVEMRDCIKSGISTNCRFISKISLSEKISSVTVRVVIYGEVLAGNESQCLITVSDREINDSAFDDLITNLKVRNVGAPLPYIRFPFIGRGCPDPVRRDNTITWEYWYDQDSEVRFYLYDLCGRERLLKDLGLQEKGLYTFTFTPDYHTPSGFYLLMLKTNSGTALRSFFIMD